MRLSQRTLQSFVVQLAIQLVMSGDRISQMKLVIENSRCRANASAASSTLSTDQSSSKPLSRR